MDPVKYATGLAKELVGVGVGLKDETLKLKDEKAKLEEQIKLIGDSVSKSEHDELKLVLDNRQKTVEFLEDQLEEEQRQRYLRTPVYSCTRVPVYPCARTNHSSGNQPPSQPANQPTR